ncbi:Asp domain protein [Ceratobasidium sp. AG-Ba]|nr:Asp domain protein [Ceratobasidium sp. AG-Ba]
MSQQNQHLRVPPTYAASLNSDFSTSDVVSSSVPQYSRSASPNERVLAGHPVRTFSALSTRDLPSKFEFATQHATLDLGERNWYCPLPCYGYAGIIEGTVRVHQIETVSKVEISLVGEVNTVISEAAVPSQGASKRFLKHKITVWDSSTSGASPHQTSHAFAISFPNHPDSPNPMSLPPSCRFVTNLATARVQYRVQVDLFRKGLRRHKRFEVEVLYLPKSFAPVLETRPMHVDNKSGTSDLWTRHALMPVQPVGRVKEALPEMLFIPSQNTLSAMSVLPYTMRIQSPSSVTAGVSRNPASLALVEVSIQLIKSTIVMVHGLRKRKDIVLAMGVVTSDYQGVTTDEGDPASSSAPMEGVRVVNGSLEVGGRSGSELSWEFENFVETKYCLLASIKPPSNVRALESAFPTCQVTIDVIMKTHTRQEELFSNEDIDTDPSIGLFTAALDDATSS